MKILYDHQAFDLQRYGGVSNSFAQLISHLPKEVEYTIAIKENDNVHINENFPDHFPPKSMGVKDFIINKPFRGQAKLYNIYSRLFPSKTSKGRNRLYSIESLKDGEYDIFHPTYFDNYFLKYLNGKPFVLTIHDMIPEQFFPPHNRQIIEKRELIKCASHFIAVSNKTKEDIIDILKVPESKVSVVYHGAPERSFKLETPLINEQYLLFVGQRGSYKSFIPMMYEILPILDRHQELKIVCTGPNFNKEEKNFFKQYSIQDRVIHCFADEEELFNLYANALCFIFPSVFEGFGIPILEAYKAQCPVLLNRKSCFPEIAGDAAIYFNLDDSGSDLNKVLEAFLLLSDSEKKELLLKQTERMTKYSWEKSALLLAQIYGRVLSNL